MFDLFLGRFFKNKVRVQTTVCEQKEEKKKQRNSNSIWNLIFVSKLLLSVCVRISYVIVSLELDAYRDE